MNLLSLLLQYLGVLIGWACFLAELVSILVIWGLWKRGSVDAFGVTACAVVYLLVRILWILESRLKKDGAP